MLAGFDNGFTQAGWKRDRIFCKILKKVDCKTEYVAPPADPTEGKKMKIDGIMNVII